MIQLVIFDTEFTTWEGAWQRQWQGPNEYKEMIQISALKVDWPSGNIVDELVVLAKPTLNPELSDYCQKLTGITQQDMDENGLTFQAAFDKFLDFCGVHITLSYGADFCVMAENFVFHKAHPRHFYGNVAPNFLDISHWIGEADPTSATVNSGRLWQHFGLEKPAGYKFEHDALSDCYSILATLKHLKSQNKNLPF